MTVMSSSRQKQHCMCSGHTRFGGIALLLPPIPPTHPHTHHTLLFQVDAYIRQVVGLPPREQPAGGGVVQSGAAAGGAAAAMMPPGVTSDDPGSGPGGARRARSAVRAEQVREG